jgi:hypothetical protein
MVTSMRASVYFRPDESSSKSRHSDTARHVRHGARADVRDGRTRMHATLPISALAKQDAAAIGSI